MAQQMQEGVNADDLADLQDDMAEVEANRAEINDMFTAVAEDGQDELLDELNDLEAEGMADELAELELGPMAAIPSQHVPANPVNAQAEEAKAMAEIEAMMMPAM